MTTSLARPPIEYGLIYENSKYTLDPENVEFLAHNQDHFGVHQAKAYKGYLYATVEESGALMWWEEVWVLKSLMRRCHSMSVEELIDYVRDTCGYA